MHDLTLFYNDAQTHTAVRSASVELGQAFLAVAQEAAATIDDLSGLQVKLQCPRLVTPAYKRPCIVYHISCSRE